MKLWLYVRKLNGDETYSHYLTDNDYFIRYLFGNEWHRSRNHSFTLNNDRIVAHNKIFPTNKVDGYFVFDTNLTIDSTLEEIDMEIKHIFPEIYL